MNKLYLVFLVSSVLVSISTADELKLKSGEVVGGKVINQGIQKVIVAKDGKVTSIENKLVEDVKATKEAAKTEVNPKIQFVTSEGKIDVELFENEAPNTVANIISLVESGFYKGQAFHRVIKGFMAQGGCPNSKQGSYGRPGTGGPKYKIADEFNSNLAHNKAGILSMANSGPNSGGSQFFICFNATPWLDGKHAIFGQVTKGFDVLKRIEKLGSRSGRTSQRITFDIKVLSKRKHEYSVIKL